MVGMVEAGPLSIEPSHGGALSDARARVLIGLEETPELPNRRFSIKIMMDGTPLCRNQ